MLRARQLARHGKGLGDLLQDRAIGAPILLRSLGTEPHSFVYALLVCVRHFVVLLLHMYHCIIRFHVLLLSCYWHGAINARPDVLHTLQWLLCNCCMVLYQFWHWSDCYRIASIGRLNDTTIWSVALHRLVDLYDITYGSFCLARDHGKHRSAKRYNLERKCLVGGKTKVTPKTVPFSKTTSLYNFITRTK